MSKETEEVLISNEEITKIESSPEQNNNFLSPSQDALSVSLNTPIKNLTKAFIGVSNTSAAKEGTPSKWQRGTMTPQKNKRIEMSVALINYIKEFLRYYKDFFGRLNNFTQNALPILKLVLEPNPENKFTQLEILFGHFISLQKTGNPFALIKEDQASPETIFKNISDIYEITIDLKIFDKSIYPHLKKISDFLTNDKNQAILREATETLKKLDTKKAINGHLKEICEAELNKNSDSDWSQLDSPGKKTKLEEKINEKYLTLFANQQAYSYLNSILSDPAQQVSRSILPLAEIYKNLAGIHSALSSDNELKASYGAAAIKAQNILKKFVEFARTVDAGIELVIPDNNYDKALSQSSLGPFPLTFICNLLRICDYYTDTSLGQEIRKKQKNKDAPTVSLLGLKTAQELSSFACHVYMNSILANRDILIYKLQEVSLRSELEDDELLPLLQLLLYLANKDFSITKEDDYYACWGGEALPSLLVTFNNKTTENNNNTNDYIQKHILQTVIFGLEQRPEVSGITLFSRKSGTYTQNTLRKIVATLQTMQEKSFEDRQLHIFGLQTEQNIRQLIIHSIKQEAWASNIPLTYLFSGSFKKIITNVCYYLDRIGPKKSPSSYNQIANNTSHPIERRSLEVKAQRRSQTTQEINKEEKSKPTKLVLIANILNYYNYYCNADLGAAQRKDLGIEANTQFGWRNQITQLAVTALQHYLYYPEKELDELLIQIGVTIKEIRSHRLFGRGENSRLANSLEEIVQSYLTIPKIDNIEKNTKKFLPKNLLHYEITDEDAEDYIQSHISQQVQARYLDYDKILANRQFISTHPEKIELNSRLKEAMDNLYTDTLFERQEAIRNLSEGPQNIVGLIQHTFNDTIKKHKELISTKQQIDPNNFPPTVDIYSQGEFAKAHAKVNNYLEMISQKPFIEEKIKQPANMPLSPLRHLCSTR